MSRYLTTKQIKDNNGKRKASTTIFPVVPFSQKDIFIKITSPERLDLLAYRFYGDASKWWIIASANALGKGTLFVPENISSLVGFKLGSTCAICKDKHLACSFSKNLIVLLLKLIFVYQPPLTLSIPYLSMVIIKLI